MALTEPPLPLLVAGNLVCHGKGCWFPSYVHLSITSTCLWSIWIQESLYLHRMSHLMQNCLKDQKLAFYSDTFTLPHGKAFIFFTRNNRQLNTTIPSTWSKASGTNQSWQALSEFLLVASLYEHHWSGSSLIQCTTWSDDILKRYALSASWTYNKLPNSWFIICPNPAKEFGVCYQ